MLIRVGRHALVAVQNTVQDVQVIVQDALLIVMEDVIQGQNLGVMIALLDV